MRAGHRLWVVLGALVALIGCSRNPSPAASIPDDGVAYEDGTQGPYLLRPKSGGFTAQLPSKPAIRFDLLLPPPGGRAVFWYAGALRCELVNLTEPGPCADQVHVLAGYIELSSAPPLRTIAEAAAGFLTQRVGAAVDTLTLGEGTINLSFRAQGLSGAARYVIEGRRLFQVLVFSPAPKQALWSVFTGALTVSEDPGRTPFPATYPEGDPLALRGRGKGFRDLRSADALRLHGPKVAPVDGQLSMLSLAELLGLAAAASCF